MDRYLDEGLLLFEQTLQILHLSPYLPLLLTPQLTQLLVLQRQLSAQLLHLAAALADD